MYRLTARMEQRLYRDLRKYHQLFDSKRCSGWELEELIVGAIKSDTQAQHHVRWKEAGHDDEADIRVRTNGNIHQIQVKSGEVKANRLVLSGHRLGRFNGDFREISDYLNNPSADMLSVPYKQVNNEQGRTHIYRISYIDKRRIVGLNGDAWETHGKSHRQTNNFGVLFTISPSMSWQVWWRIPESAITSTEWIEI